MSAGHKRAGTCVDTCNEEVRPQETQAGATVERGRAMFSLYAQPCIGGLQRAAICPYTCSRPIFYLPAAVSIVQQAATYVDDPALQFEFCRWCTLWQFTTYVVFSPTLSRPKRCFTAVVLLPVFCH